MTTEKEKILKEYPDYPDLSTKDLFEVMDKCLEAGKAEQKIEGRKHYLAGRKEAIKQFSKDLKKRIRNKDGEFGGYSLGDFATELVIKVIDEELKSKLGELAK